MKKILIILFFASNLAFANSTNHSWIRVFANSTREWKSTNFQTFPASLFEYFNWPKGVKHKCNDNTVPGEPGCPIIETDLRSERAHLIFEALASYELSGIPNIESKKLPIKIKLKKIFGKKIRNCFEAGIVMPSEANPKLCCSGFINKQTNTCQLQDFVDLSIYTNLNVSSEANILDRSLFDPNGYIKEPSYVAQIACAKQMCASNNIGFGILISNLLIPGIDREDFKISRFMEGSERYDNTNGLLSLYDKGLKINTHAYCLPAGTNIVNSTNDLIVIHCR